MFAPADAIMFAPADAMMFALADAMMIALAGQRRWTPANCRSVNTYGYCDIKT